MKINSEIRRELYEFILSVPYPFPGIYVGNSYNDVTIVDFLKLIWDLAAMPSEDSRFKNAEADAYQHLVNNDDWDVDYTFLTRFNLLRESDGVFVKFIEAVVSPEVRNSDEEIQEYVGGINPILSKSGHKLYVDDVIDNHPIYRVKEGLNHYDYVQDESDNDYVIYVDEDPKSFPSFVLEEDTWDDYGRKTRYGLWFYKNAESCYKIGRVKIMNADESVTYRTLPSGVKSFGPQIL